MTTRTNPTHWIWQQTYPHRFDPSEDAYLVMRELCETDSAPGFTRKVEAFIAEGMSAEQIVAICHLDDYMPPEGVRALGEGLAYWIQRMRENA